MDLGDFDHSSITSVILTYMVDGGLPTNVSMTRIIDDTWEGVIPPQPAGVEVEYSIIINLENGVVTENTTYFFTVVAVDEDDNSSSLLPLDQLTTPAIELGISSHQLLFISLISMFVMRDLVRRKY